MSQDKFVGPNSLLYIWSKIKSLITDMGSNKVDKISGKGLSTNDLTDTLKANYDTAYNHSQATHAPTNAQANVIESIAVNGTDVSISNKKASLAVPTTVAELGDAGNYALKSDITSIYRWKGSVATEADLPTEGLEIGDVYDTADTGMNFGWTGEKWDELGQKFQIEELTNAEIDAIITL